jgi:hypothetical protein
LFESSMLPPSCKSTLLIMDLKGLLG